MCVSSKFYGKDWYLLITKCRSLYSYHSFPCSLNRADGHSAELVKSHKNTQNSCKFALLVILLLVSSWRQLYRNTSLMFAFLYFSKCTFDAWLCTLSCILDRFQNRHRISNCLHFFTLLFYLQGNSLILAQNTLEEHYTPTGTMIMFTSSMSKCTHHDPSI